MDTTTAKQIHDDVNTVIKALTTDNAKPPIEAMGRLLGQYLMDVHATRLATIELLIVQNKLLQLKKME